MASSLLCRRTTHAVARRLLHGCRASQLTSPDFPCTETLTSVSNTFRNLATQRETAIPATSVFNSIGSALAPQNFSFSLSARSLSSSANRDGSEKRENGAEKPENGDEKPENYGDPNGVQGSEGVEGDEATVERDTSAAAKEFRAELARLRESIFHLSRAAALLAITQLSCGAWIHFALKPAMLSEISCQSIFAFVFSAVFALSLRKVLKPMTFFTKIEEQGRLQLQTLALQITKGVTALFLRINVVAVLCAIGISTGMLWNGFNKPTPTVEGKLEKSEE